MTHEEQTAFIIECQRKLDTSRRRSEEQTAKYEAFERQINDAAKLIEFIHGQQLQMMFALAFNENFGKENQKEIHKSDELE